MAAGREIWGFPKKLAEITIRSEGDGMWAQMERPKGNLICSAGMRPEKPVEVKKILGASYRLSDMVLGFGQPVKSYL
ncbi:MAG: acetoacetate decarboxylase family protein [Proteobacteria bacterium]|nr:acetoacetate decarboxylase family protein [Pseudomonadota bacterium]MBU1696698.1 acetoacetate decarboxylase family protein [Pseudomonadota bacterium]